MTIDKKKPMGREPPTGYNSAPPRQRQFGQKMTTKNFTNGKILPVVNTHSSKF